MKRIFHLTLIAFLAIALHSSYEVTKTAHKSVMKDVPVQTASAMSLTLIGGLDKVLDSINYLNSSVNDQKKIEEAAEMLSENWDEIEEKVEEKYPKDYKNIEKSLYPLLAEAKRTNPNLLTVKQLLKESTTKITEFKNKVDKTAS